jgi:hypothetical protein
MSDVESFRRSAAAGGEPAGLAPPLAGLWWDAAGDWQQAHRAVQDDEGRNGAWVHAYLHRKEGDHDNAGYWYRRAGRAPATGPLEAEWEAIARALLGGGAGREPAG